MAISSYGVVLKWGESAETVSKVVDIKDFGSLIGDPNLLETTTLSDPAQTHICGINKSDNIPFTVNYTKEDFKSCKEAEGKNQFYALEFSDGSKFTWQGQHKCSVPGKGVDAVLEFVVNVIPSSAVVFASAT